MAGIFRNHAGDWVHQKCKAQSALMGELLAITVGLQIIVEKGWDYTLIHTDSKKVVNRVQDGSITDVNLLLVNQCRELLPQQTEIKLEFAPKST